jgi:hypothetical protein
MPKGECYSDSLFTVYRQHKWLIKENGSNSLWQAHAQTLLRLAAPLYKRKSPCKLNENI